MNIQLPCSYSEFQRYRRKLAQTYQATVLPWIKEIFKGLIDEDGKRLKNAIQKEYLPIIEHLARQRELNTKQTASDYSHAFKVWKPEEVETISPQVLAESFAFRG